MHFVTFGWIHFCRLVIVYSSLQSNSYRDATHTHTYTAREQERVFNMDENTMAATTKCDFSILGWWFCVVFFSFSLLVFHFPSCNRTGKCSVRIRIEKWFNSKIGAKWYQNRLKGRMWKKEFRMHVPSLSARAHTHMWFRKKCIVCMCNVNKFSF